MPKPPVSKRDGKPRAAATAVADAGPWRRFLSVGLAAAVPAFIAYLCAFELFDRDFWMHVKIGELVLKTHWIIQTDPFAYTRAGLPFLANHEWLAQIVLYLIFHAAGATGIILFRTAMIVLTFALLLSINPAGLWPNGLLAIWAAIVAQPGYVERPQLFTFVLLAAFLRFAYKYLESSDSPAPEAPHRDRRLFAAFLILQVLWVNFHGGACVLGLIVAGALFCDRLYEKAQLRFAAVLLIGLTAASFFSPITYHNVTYLYSLMTDKTTAFIGEHQPRPASVYWPELGPFWALGLLSLFLSRKGRVFSLLVLAATGYLSRKALRHEMLFVFTVVGAFVFHLKHSVKALALLDRLAARKAVSGALTAALLAVLGWASFRRHITASQADGMYTLGYGTFAPARGAADFLERENVAGPLFNTYGIGGYLIYRGFPVYIDGRNVDYGFDYMMRTFRAETDPQAWRALEDRYGFTTAVIDYAFAREKNYLQFCVHLDRDPRWALVYLDDWTGVYVKDIPANRALIERLRYSLLNPERFDDASWLASLSRADAAVAEGELRRVAQGDAEGVKADLALARLSLGRNDLSQARALAQGALEREPLRPEAYAVLAAAAVQAQDWKEAAKLYRRMLALAGDSYPNLNHRFIDDVFAKAQALP